ncbi:MAG: DsbA family protein [Candidatus Kerfeldbacteria bacterium]|nr:DsbA family protein [Candidatus Kerfeldbacteria bacterium]
MWYNSFGKVVLVIVLCFVLLLGVAFGLLVFSQYYDLNTTNTLPVQTGNTTNANQASLGYVAPDADDDPYLGHVDAAVEIIAFEDFQCPFCKTAEPILEDVYRLYPNDVKVVYRDFPLYTIHDQAVAAAQAGECADEQGKFWAWHDEAFANQSALAAAPAVFSVWAETAGLDVTTFEACVVAERYADEVQKDLNEGFLAGVSATPTFFINGQRVLGIQSEAEWIELIEAALAN